MQTTRRQFVKAGFGCALGMSLSPALSFAAGKSKSIPIGIQLYAVRGLFSGDVPGTLKKLGQLGYKGVEFWGYGGTPKVFKDYAASDLRKMLDDDGLKCCGIHMDLKALSKDNFQRTIENNQVLGNKYLNVAAAKDKMDSEQNIAELASLLNDAAAKCKPHKMVVGYHAHPFDFVKVKGLPAWEILFSHTDPSVNMQMDIGNCLGGDGDPIAMLKKFPGRTLTIHLKEHKEKTLESDFYKEVFKLCETTCGTEWYIVEMGEEGGDNFDVPRDAITRLHRLGK